MAHAPYRSLALALSLPSFLWSACYRHHELGATLDGADDAGPSAGDADVDAGRSEVDAGPRSEIDAASTPIDVRGKVIGPLGYPISGWPVVLGERQVVTDAQGRFAFDDVRPPYDLQILSQHTLDVDDLWVFRGINRTDPTLQFDDVRGTSWGWLELEQHYVPEADDAGEDAGTEVVTEVSFASAQRAFDWLAEPRENFVGVQWRDDDELPGVMRGLVYSRPKAEYPAEYPSGLDNRYLALANRRVTIPESRFPNIDSVSLRLLPFELDTESFPVRAEGGWGDPARISRGVLGAVTFADGSRFQPVSVAGDTAWQATPLRVPLPAIPRAGFAFMATQSIRPVTPFDTNYSFGCAHAEPSSSAETTVLRVPEPRNLLSPQDGARDVDPATRFEWSGRPTVAVLGLRCNLSTRSHLIHVVNAGTSASLPKSPLLPPLPVDKRCTWRVEVHGAYDSVDEALHPDGMLEPCLMAHWKSLRGAGGASISFWREVYFAD